MSASDSLLERVGFGRVLVPLDGSEFALAALPTARALSERFKAELVTISVADDEDEARRLRRHAVESLASGDGADHIQVAVSTAVAETITAQVAELAPCLLCMSTRGRGRVAGTVIGSVARAVLRSTREPLIAVGPLADRPGSLVGPSRRRPASWPEPLSVRRLVACVDGSPTSEAVLPVAARWATALDMQLSVLTIAEEAAPLGDQPAPNRFGPVEPARYVEQLADRWTEVIPDAVGEVAFDPLSVASGLRAHLATQPAGLVTVTTHARTGLNRIRLGAAAADIVRTSTAPTLVVPLADL
ncbi:MAG TPA: universal stress protein [Acidimicrobiia bacterium]|nr:universal stress protein [Acidimicrobiia bacterium]